MNATASSAQPWRPASSRTNASLSFTSPWHSTPSSAARCAATPPGRAVTNATATPARRSSARPWPSRTWKNLLSRPSASSTMRPSVRVPSTSKQASRTAAARARTSGAQAAAGSKATLDDPRAQQVVDVQRPDHALRLVHDDQRIELVRLHQLRRLDRERVAADRLRRAGHDLLDAGAAQV